MAHGADDMLVVFGDTPLISAQTLERAESLWGAHDYDGANNAFKALIAANPKNADYRVRWGDLFYERFNPGEAQKLYQEALGIDPKNAKADPATYAAIGARLKQRGLVQ